MQIESQTDIVLLGMEQSTLDKVGEAYGTVTFTVDPGIYKSVTETTPTVRVVGDYTCVVVRGDLDEQLVYDLCKVMYENQETLSKAVVDINELTPATAIPGGAAEATPEQSATGTKSPRSSIPNFPILIRKAGWFSPPSLSFRTF